MTPTCTSREWRMATVLLHINNPRAMKLDEQPQSVQHRYIVAAKRVLKVAEVTR